MNNLDIIKDNIIKNNPDYIFIAGDLIDSLKVLSHKKLMSVFYEWLDNLGNNRIPVIVILGNHDSYNNTDFRYNIYIENLKKLNISLLDNSIYEDNYIKVSGFTLPKDTYHSSNSLSNTRKYYNKLNKRLFRKSNKINIALIHNPMYIINTIDILSNFDIIMAGHMHNGLMLPFMEKVFKSNSGIISPDKKFFPKVSRNQVIINNNKFLLISGGITKLSKSAGLLNKFSILYPMEITNININN